MSKIIEKILDRELAHVIETINNDFYYIDTSHLDFFTEEQAKRLGYSYEVFVTKLETFNNTYGSYKDWIGNPIIFRFDNHKDAYEMHRHLCENLENFIKGGKNEK